MMYVRSKDYKEFLGELQLSFVCLLIAQNYAGLIQWKNLVQLICSCKEALETYAETFYNEFFGKYICYMYVCGAYLYLFSNS